MSPRQQQMRKKSSMDSLTALPKSYLSSFLCSLIAVAITLSAKQGVASAPVDHDLSESEQLVQAASGLTEVQKNKVWGCEDGSSPGFNPEVCFQECWAYHFPVAADSEEEIDRGLVNGTLSWCKAVCEEELGHPDSAYEECRRLIRNRSKQGTKE